MIVYWTEIGDLANQQPANASPPRLAVKVVQVIIAKEKDISLLTIN